MRTTEESAVKVVDLMGRLTQTLTDSDTDISEDLSAMIQIIALVALRAAAVSDVDISEVRDDVVNIIDETLVKMQNSEQFQVLMKEVDDDQPTA